MTDARIVRISLGPAFALDVNIGAWSFDYGTEATPAAVRQDVLSYIQDALHGLAGAENWEVIVK